MTEGKACPDDLRALVSRADRDDLRTAQDILIQCILREDGADRRMAVLDTLRAELTRDDQAGISSPEQRAFHTVLLSMIERTRTMAGSTAR
ncbi:hypothetical protein SAMN05216360_105127 [Methylobacterium phyllostachyos]|uniref:Uncharacterized protein n=1 Tax=Methylobacterium phyllostachyos TaxID=582672 RepID=A0A1G9Y1G5_9HYPH|nr:hypothetical protein SAMN05216360_105127 [Methylobacterium phyllostachyos]